MNAELKITNVGRKIVDTQAKQEELFKRIENLAWEPVAKDRRLPHSQGMAIVEYLKNVNMSTRYLKEVALYGVYGDSSLYGLKLETSKQDIEIYLYDQGDLITTLACRIENKVIAGV